MLNGASRVLPPSATHEIRDFAHGKAAAPRCRRGKHGQAEGARGRARPDRQELRQGLDHAARRQRPHHGRGGDLDRLARPRHRAGHRRPAARPRHRDLRPGIVGQDHAGPAGGGGSPEEGRHLRLRRCRARARPRLCQEARRQGRGPADLAARRRRAGARDRRHAGALGRHRRAGGGLRLPPSRPRPSSRARWATCSPACRRA